MYVNSGLFMAAWLLDTVLRKRTRTDGGEILPVLNLLFCPGNRLLLHHEKKHRDTEVRKQETE